MPNDIKDHATEEQLERYSMGTMEEPELGEVEEHLLLCQDCQKRLGDTDTYLSALRNAAAKLDADDESQRLFWTRVSSALTFRRAAWVMAVSALLLGAVAVRVIWQGRRGQPVAVTLEASRGPELQHAPANRTLQLTLSIIGLQTAAAYQVEIVDAGGKRLSQSSVAPDQDTVRTSVPGGLREGTYFVRVYSPARELLREYGLQVD